jgi:hypothetical protein
LQSRERLAERLFVLALARRERDKALDVLGADQIGQKRHELERFRESTVPALNARAQLAFQLLSALQGQFDDPARRPLVFRPGLDLPVRFVGQVRVGEMQLKARDPLIDDVAQALIGRVHGAMTLAQASPPRQRPGLGIHAEPFPDMSPR